MYLGLKKKVLEEKVTVIFKNEKIKKKLKLDLSDDKDVVYFKVLLEVYLLEHTLLNKIKDIDVLFTNKIELSAIKYKGEKYNVNKFINKYTKKMKGCI